MRRYPVVIGATAAGLAGVLTFHSHGGSSFATGPQSGANAPSSSGSGSTAPPSTTPSTTATAPTGSTQTSGPQAPVTSSATGALEQYGFGQLAVRVTMSGGKITHLRIATLQTAETYSQQLADQVIPILRHEVLSAQSARVNAISGATYTSEAYLYSVQSALDHLAK